MSYLRPDDNAALRSLRQHFVRGFRPFMSDDGVGFPNSNSDFIDQLALDYYIRTRPSQDKVMVHMRMTLSPEYTNQLSDVVYIDAVEYQQIAGLYAIVSRASNYPDVFERLSLPSQYFMRSLTYRINRVVPILKSWRDDFMQRALSQATEDMLCTGTIVSSSHCNCHVCKAPKFRKISCRVCGYTPSKTLEAVNNA